MATDPSAATPAPPTPPLLQVDALFKYYRQFLAINGVSFDLWPGEIVGLVGPNGAGKTTILRCITGVLRASSGGVRCAGLDMIRDPIHAKPQVALVPETPNLYELLTVTEHLRFVHMAFGEDPATFAARAEYLLDRLQLTEKRSDLIASLSKGMKQKLAVACAFVRSARVLLFDEPFIGVDPAGQRAVRSLIEDAAMSGAAVLVSSHILETVEQLCSRVMILHRGQLIAQGTLDQIRSAGSFEDGLSLEDVFLTLTQEGRMPE